MPQQGLHRLHVLAVCSQQRRERVPEYVPVEVLGDAGALGGGNDMVPHQGLRPQGLSTVHA